jgi:carboxypeptidase Q
MVARGVFLLAGVCALAQAADDKATAASYKETADKLIDAALGSDSGLIRLEYLCYRIGNRLSGSLPLTKAVEWSVGEMKAAGLQNVHTISTKVPHWVRGEESATMTEPLQKRLFMLGLGGSIPTPRGGITADVVAVSNFNELEKLGRKAIEGKIVVFDVPYVEYGETVIYRVSGASRAARLGAVGMLVRSVTPRSLRDPHTGAMNYAEADQRIPAAAISVEDAIYIHKLAQSGTRVRVHLQMESHFEAEADSADVVGDIVGREKPDEVVVIGGHLDSWDVGQGAHDDGSGVMAALEAAALMKRLGLKPRRTIRVVFWTNEENGGRGGVAYRNWVGKNVDKHIAAIEMDGGAEAPIGFDFALGHRRERGTPKGALAAPAGGDIFERASAIGELLKRIDAGRIVPGEGEADIEPLMAQGVPGFGLRTVMTHYFDYHHTNADTFDKIVPDEFRRCAAAMAVMSFVLADWP